MEYASYIEIAISIFLAVIVLKCTVKVIKIIAGIIAIGMIATAISNALF